jgi:capsular polysaccharide biosynthesis protein
MTDTPNRHHRQGPALVRGGRLPAWSLLVAGAVAGGVLGGSYGVLRTPTYTATSYVVAVPTKSADPAAALGFAQAYGRVATQVAVLGDAQVWAGVPVRTLQQNVQAQTSPDAPMVSVTATSSRADVAADMANAVTRALTRHANDTKADTHVELLQFSRAVKPASPSSASWTVTALVGASAGGLLGALALLVRPRRESQDAGRPASVPGPAPAADVHGQL